MATLDDAFAQLWKSVKSVPLNTDAAIYKEWRSKHAEWGSPIDKEVPLDSGGVYQVFTHAVVQWTPDRGVEVIEE